MGQDGVNSDEFKREAIGLLASSGRPLLQIANELGISPSMRNWRRPGPGIGDFRLRRVNIACAWSATS
jgi:hypothetical protein